MPRDCFVISTGYVHMARLSFPIIEQYRRKQGGFGFLSRGSWAYIGSVMPGVLSILQVFPLRNLVGPIQDVPML